MNNYKIGKYLKLERRNKNLTQAEFLQGVLSVSQYSRIENEEQDIKMGDFIRIMYLNKINFNNFFEYYLKEKELVDFNNDDKILEKLAQFFYSRDLKKIKAIQTTVNSRTLTLKIKLMIAILEGDIQNLDKNVIDGFSEELNKSDDWTDNKEFLQLFSSSMQIFSIERLNVYMSDVLSKYRESISKESYEIQRRIASVCINYLGCMYKEKEVLFYETISLLNNLSENPDLLMYKMLKVYFISLRENNHVKAQEILKILEESGYSNFIQNLPRI